MFIYRLSLVKPGNHPYQGDRRVGNVTTSEQAYVWARAWFHTTAAEPSAAPSLIPVYYPRPWPFSRLIAVAMAGRPGVRDVRSRYSVLGGPFPAGVAWETG